MVFFIVGGIIALLIIVGILFVNLSPQFGGKVSAEQKEEYARSSNYKEGKFTNLLDVEMKMGFGDYITGIVKYFSSQPNTIPEKDIPTQRIDSLTIVNYDFEKPRLIWFGHSTFLLQINKKNILIDPMLGNVPAPHPKLGSPRFSKTLPIEIEQLPQIDLVILSHDHYDHLDYGSILKLKDKVKAFYTPLGVGSHLTEWGISRNDITELDWWEEVDYEGLRLVCAPAQHFSGRGVADRNATLWSSWIIRSEKDNIYFSGDSGYGEHFKAIGEKYGPFDFAMLECGQYNEQWSEIHMMPEETARAGVDLKANLIMPIHWGAFKLAFHTWTDPVERVTRKAKELGIPTLVPEIGAEIVLDSAVNDVIHPWWEELE
ncbi:MBL fold metallo-hydrolase [Fulvivirga sp. M361]|nr:MBL fold metallo-hydrolase [Fulvivirga sp. M361]